MFVFLYCDIRSSTSSTILNLACRVIYFIFFPAECDLMIVIIGDAHSVIWWYHIYILLVCCSYLKCWQNNPVFKVFCSQLCKIKQLGSEAKKDWIKSVVIQKSKGNVYEAVWKNAVKMVNSDQQAFHEVCSGHVASFVTSEVTTVNSDCKVISVTDLHFSSWISSGLVKGFPCKCLIDVM